MALSALTRARIDEIRTFHKPDGITLTRRGRFAWWRNLRARRCHMCGQRMPCSQIRWCNGVEAGRITPAVYGSTP